MATSDLTFLRDGGKVVVMPHTENARRWIANLCHAGSDQVPGGTLSIEERFAADVVQGATYDGLTVEHAA